MTRKKRTEDASREKRKVEADVEKRLGNAQCESEEIGKIDTCMGVCAAR